MSKLFELKDWLSVPATATHLSNVIGESVTEDDVMDFLIEGRLLASLKATTICACPLVRMSDTETASHTGSKWKLPDGTYIGPTGDTVVLYCQKPIDLPVNRDGAMLLVAAKGQENKTGSIQVPPGVVIQTPGTDEYYCVLGGSKIPETYGQIVVRTESLRVFERQIKDISNAGEDANKVLNVTPLVEPGAQVPAQTTATPATVVAVVTSAPPLKQPAQEKRILELLAAQGHDPLNLPNRAPGKSGVKAEVKKLALKEPALFNKNTFDTAWQRIRDDGRVDGGN
jgi:hypothetical protein